MDALKKKKSKLKLLESSYCEIFAHTEIVTNPTLMWGMRHCTRTPWQPVWIFSESPHHSPFLWALTLQIRVLFASHMWFYHIQVSVKEVWYYLWHNFIYRRWFIMENNRRTNTFTSQEWALTPAYLSLRLPFTSALHPFSPYMVWGASADSTPRESFARSFPRLCLIWNNTVCVCMWLYKD